MSITIPQGSDLTVQITDLDDLTGATGYLSVKNAAGTVVIHKDTDEASEGAVIDDESMEFYLVPGDTSGLTVGKYAYDAWIETAAGKRYQVRSVQAFTVTERVTVL